MMRRFSSMTFTGMVRCEVASGISTLAFMFCAMRAAASAHRDQLFGGAALFNLQLNFRRLRRRRTSRCP